MPQKVKSEEPKSKLTSQNSAHIAVIDKNVSKQESFRLKVANMIKELI